MYNSTSTERCNINTQHARVGSQLLATVAMETVVKVHPDTGYKATGLRTTASYHRPRPTLKSIKAKTQAPI